MRETEYLEQNKKFIEYKKTDSRDLSRVVWFS